MDAEAEAKFLMGDKSKELMAGERKKDRLKKEI